jgi:hypothetical protein
MDWIVPKPIERWQCIADLQELRRRILRAADELFPDGFHILDSAGPIALCL